MLNTNMLLALALFIIWEWREGALSVLFDAASGKLVIEGTR